MLNHAKLLKEAQTIHKAIEKNKKLYARLDEIIQNLIDFNFDKEGEIHLVDNFKDKNVQWRATGMRRFELRFPKEKSPGTSS